jgi:hypothetical protein
MEEDEDKGEGRKGKEEALEARRVVRRRGSHIF